MPERLLAKIASNIDTPRPLFVEVQIAIALDIQLAVPLRPQNLSSLHWLRHLIEPDGPKGKLLLHIPADEAKARRRDLTVKIPSRCCS